MNVIDTGTNELLCEIRQRVAVVTLNKPHKKNALGDVLTPALRTVLAELDKRSDVGCVMITGAGDAFCAGGDVSGMGQNSGSALAHGKDEQQVKAAKVEVLLEKQRTLSGRLYGLSKPTVAALPGAAAGAGMSIALACDLRIASEHAFFVTAFKNIGLSGDYGASWFLPRLVGLGRAKALFYRSERLGAEAALKIGLVDEVFAVEDFAQAAFGYCAEIAAGPPEALARMKQNLQMGLHQSLDDSLLLEAEHLIESMDSDESKEAISAFMAKRPPIFSAQ